MTSLMGDLSVLDHPQAYNVVLGSWLHHLCIPRSHQFLAKGNLQHFDFHVFHSCKTLMTLVNITRVVCVRL